MTGKKTKFKKLMSLSLIFALVVMFMPMLGTKAEAAGTVKTYTVVDDGSASLGSSNTTRSVAAAANGDIYVTYYKSGDGVYVNRLKYGADGFGDPIKLANSAGTRCPEIAVSSNGKVYVAFAIERGIKIARYDTATEWNGNNWKEPVLIATNVSGESVHMATDGDNIYLIGNTGTKVYRTTDAKVLGGNEQALVSDVSSNNFMYSDIMVDKKTHQVIIVEDNPTIKFYVSNDYCQTITLVKDFTTVAGEKPNVYYSVASFGSIGANKYFVIGGGAGSQTYLFNISDGSYSRIDAGNCSNQFGRSIAADNEGNIATGFYKEGKIYYKTGKVAADGTVTFNDEVEAASSQSANAALTPRGDLIFYYKDGSTLKLQTIVGAVETSQGAAPKPEEPKAEEPKAEEPKVEVKKQDNSWTQGLSMPVHYTVGDKIEPKAEAANGEVVFKYSTSENGEYTDTVPTDAGTYYCRAYVAGDDKYNELISPAHQFVITAKGVSATVKVTAKATASATARASASAQIGKVAAETELAEIAELNTAEKIINKLQDEIKKTNNKVKNETTAVYDVTAEVTISYSDGTVLKTSDPYTLKDMEFEIVLPYPQGTNRDKFNFSVIHMFTYTSAVQGHKAGELETPEVTKKADGLHLILHGTSPVIVAWEAIDTPVVSSPKTGYDTTSPYLMIMTIMTAAGVSLVLMGRKKREVRK